MSNKRLELPVMKVNQPIGEFYLASIKPEDLVEISYSDVRRLAEEQRDLERYLGIQRPVNGKRIKEIKKYIEGRDATFPTAVIVAIDEKCAEFKEVNDKFGILTLCPYVPEEGIDDEEIPFGKIAKVIDGQHRIASFMDENDNYCFAFDDRPFDINLSIFIGADISEQANIFATVNLAQTKVNRSLVYDLAGLEKRQNPFKTCHNVAVVLDREETSPFYKRIKRLGTATPGRKNELITQASFVEALIKFISPDPVRDRNALFEGNKLQIPESSTLKKYPFRKLFIENKELDIAEILLNYFDSIRRKWPNSWNETGKSGNLLPRSNAFKAFMKYLKDDVYLDLVGPKIGEIPSSDQFDKYFRHIELKDEDFTIRNFAPGSGGQSTFLKMLRGEICLDDMIE